MNVGSKKKSLIGEEIRSRAQNIQEILFDAHDLTF